MGNCDLLSGYFSLLIHVYALYVFVRTFNSASYVVSGGVNSSVVVFQVKIYLFDEWRILLTGARLWNIWIITFFICRELGRKALGCWRSLVSELWLAIRGTQSNGISRLAGWCLVRWFHHFFAPLFYIFVLCACVF